MGWRDVNWGRVGRGVLSGGATELGKAAEKYGGKYGKKAANIATGGLSTLDPSSMATGGWMSGDEAADLKGEWNADKDADIEISDPVTTTTDSRFTGDGEGSGAAASLADVLGESPGDAAGASADEMTEQAGQSWGEVQEGFQTGMDQIDANLQDQLGGVAARGSMNSRRATEMGALQGASGFGGMQAGKQLQAQMATNEFERDLRNNAFEQQLGLQKGLINATQNKFGREFDMAKSRGDVELMANINKNRDAMDALMNMDPELFGDGFEDLLEEITGGIGEDDGN